jgi:hypothetical protein
LESILLKGLISDELTLVTCLAKVEHLPQKGTFPSFPFSTSSKLSAAHTQGDREFHPLRRVDLHTLFGIFLDALVSSACLLLIQSSTYIRIDSGAFILYFGL